MALRFDLFGAQIDGARDYQEDAFLITQLRDEEKHPSVLVMVADGMGGHAAGNVASNLAVQGFNTHISAKYPTPQVNQILHQSVIQANTSIQETISETPALEGMGCTMVAAVIEKRGLWWCSVGDSHLYMIRDRKLQKKNADHSYGGFLDRMKAEGKEIQPEAGLSRNMLMSAVTGAELVEIDCPETSVEIQSGDRLILCSDGMDTLSKGQLIQISQLAQSSKECAQALLQAVEKVKKPKQDNTTVVVVDVLETEEVEEKLKTRTRMRDKKIDQLARVAEAQERLEGKDRSISRAKKSSQPLAIGVGGLLILCLIGFLLVSNPALLPFHIPGISPPPEPAAPSAGTETAETETVATAPSPQIIQAPEAPVSIELLRDTLANGDEGPEMAILPGGTFPMGDRGLSVQQNELPQHPVNVSAFAIGKYEVSIGQYQRFARATGRNMQADASEGRQNYPVSHVSWEDAQAYVQWLSEQTGENYRLPSEAEWEYAAGANVFHKYWWGPQMVPGFAHCRLGCEPNAGTGQELDVNDLAPIGSLPENPFKLHDTAGNVAEWAADCWHPNYTGAPDDGSIWPGGDCRYHVVRGGSFDSVPENLRPKDRDRRLANTRVNTLGFRIARDLPQPQQETRQETQEDPAPAGQ